MKRPNKRTALGYAVAVALVVSWFVVNPIGRFGFCEYGLTIYSGVPIPATDFQLRSDGKWRRVEKTHDIEPDLVEWLLASKPEVLLIATGWDGLACPAQCVCDIKECEVIVAPDAEAIELYNRLRRQGKRVSIHYHSTC